MYNISTQDAECYVGSVVKDECIGKLTPFMFVDLGVEQPSFCMSFASCQKLHLDAIPARDGTFNYYVSLVTVEAEMESDFEFFFSVTAVQHREFIEGCKESNGRWYLLFLAADAIEYLIDSNSNIVKRDYYARDPFAYQQ